MKVLIINSLCGAGSTGRIVSDLYDMLKNHGHIVKIAYGHGTPTRVPFEDTIRVNNKIGYYVHNALSRITDRAGFYSTCQTRKFIKYIESYKPDIIHLHNLHGYWINIKILFQYLAKYDKPVIWTLHDCWAFTGHCSHYSYNGCNKWLTECKHCGHLEVYPMSYFRDQSCRNYQEKKELFTSIRKMHLVTPSTWLAEEAKKSFLHKYPVTTIPNGIDLKVFKPTKTNVRERIGIDDSKIMILAVSFVWNKEKGWDDIMLLNERLDHTKYQIVMVGLTDDLIKQLPDNIIGILRTSSLQELVELYTSADLFINPSYQETMGMVTAEALACGTPAIVYNQTAVPEVVDTHSGFVVKAGDVNAVLENLEKAISLNPTDCRKRVDLFERYKQYDNYYKIYEKLWQV